MATVTNQAATQNRHETPYQADAFVINLVDEGYTTGTNPAIDIPVGFALVGGTVVVEDAVTGATSLQFRLSGGDNLTGAIPIANLVAGDVRDLRTGGTTATTSVAGYAKTVALTLDIVVAGTVNGGKIVIIPEIIRIDSAILNP